MDLDDDDHVTALLAVLLSSSVHCSIIGTCLTTAELRRIMGKIAKRPILHLSDHDLHAEAVGLCDKHNVYSKLIHKALDQRHRAVINQFGRIMGEPAVLDKWDDCKATGDIVGAYWAVLTHPNVGHTGIRRVFGDIHMLSHLVGAANRTDIRRLAALEKENAELQAKTDRQQLKLREVITSRDATIRQLAQMVAHEALSSISSDEDTPTTVLQHAVADLQARLSREVGRRERLERRLHDALAQNGSHERRIAQAEETVALLTRELEALERRLEVPETASASSIIGARCVLYVGGRPGVLHHMREALGKAAGELRTHDAGQHDQMSLLPGLVSRADFIVFPVDCVSHEAALAVKRLCRQFEKRWMPLRSSGVASFLSAMLEAADTAPV